MSEPNPEYKDAPFEETRWTLEKGLHKNTNHPIPADGEYWDEDGDHVMTIKGGYVLINKNWKYNTILHPFYDQPGPIEVLLRDETIKRLDCPKCACGLFPEVAKWRRL